jgi:hypothetical protein
MSDVFKNIEKTFELLRRGYADKVETKDWGHGAYSVKIIDVLDRDDIPEELKRNFKRKNIYQWIRKLFGSKI